jgi:hypothetical protein
MFTAKAIAFDAARNRLHEAESIDKDPGEAAKRAVDALLRHDDANACQTIEIVVK